MRLLTIGLAVSSARVFVLWILVTREWAHQQSITYLPLVFLLYPEGFLLPGNFNWTMMRAVAFSGVLFCGSFLIVAIYIAATAALTDSR